MLRAGVNAVIFSEDKHKILILKRRDVPVWVIPGGGIDDGETPEETVVRECFEETGCKVVIVRKVAVYEPINRLVNTTHLFECKITNGIPQVGDETKEIGFYSISSLPKTFFHFHRDMVQDTLLQEQKVMIKDLTQITYFMILKYLISHPIKLIRFILSANGYPINS